MRVRCFETRHDAAKRCALDCVLASRAPWDEAEERSEEAEPAPLRGGGDRLALSLEALAPFLATRERMEENEYPRACALAPCVDATLFEGRQESSEEEEAAFSAASRAADEEDVGEVVAVSTDSAVALVVSNKTAPGVEWSRRVVAACALPLAAGCSATRGADPKRAASSKTGEEETHETPYVQTCRVVQGSEAAVPKVWGLDCEMVNTRRGPELARVTLVSFDDAATVVLDLLVKPTLAVVDYCTRWSGIDKELLRPVRARLAQAQAAVLSLVSAEDVLVGHSLDNDLRALRLAHAKCCDTSLLYGHPKGASFKRSLKQLAAEFLERAIQAGQHDSAEDAIAALDLFRLKLERGLHFGAPPARRKTDGVTCLERIALAGCRVAAAADDDTALRKLARGAVSFQTSKARVLVLSLSFSSARPLHKGLE